MTENNTNVGLNIVFPIYSANGKPFYDLVMRKATYECVVMSLGDKITGDVYYKDNNLAVTMQEYVEYNGVKYVLVNPPTIVREGTASNSGDAKGMTKYSFEFYHPMYMLGNFPFTDVAVSSDERQYFAQNSVFNWRGTGLDFIAKLNKNLQNTEWVVAESGNEESHNKLAQFPEDIAPTKAGEQTQSSVISFDNVMISDALKTCYDTWHVPFVIDQIKVGEEYYNEGKRFVIVFGLPSNEILDEQGNAFVFRMGQGVGLKNNSRTPKNNKIVTRIAGYGSTDNIQYGYPQIVWTGDQTWDFTIGNDSTNPNSYPIYDGIVNGERVRLIKHPFTRDVLMPSIYRETVNKKVNPLAQGYNPDIEIVDYYDAPNSYPHPINLLAPSYHKQGFEGIKPRLGDNKVIVEVSAYDDIYEGAITFDAFIANLDQFIANSKNENNAVQIRNFKESIQGGLSYSDKGEEGGSYTWHRYMNYEEKYRTNEYVDHVKYKSSETNFDYVVIKQGKEIPAPVWDDTMDDDGNYLQSYFKVTLPQFDFDLYACASITQEMKINMRTGACQGCTFPIQVDWDDYKKNFYDSEGNFAPQGTQRNYDKYPDSSQGEITVVVKKEIETFGTLMPNIYQQPKAGDKFVILGISLPQTYVTNAESELDDTMMQYMLENNVYYFEYPLKFDEAFLGTHTNILEQMRTNTIVRFEYPKGSDIKNALYIKQISIKYGQSPLPQYDITLTDDVEIVLNSIGQVTDDVSRVRVQLNELQKYYGDEVMQLIREKLSRVSDDIAQGRITFQQGLDTIGDALIHGNIGSPQFTQGLYTGKGWRIDNLGNAELESLRVRSYLEIVELLVNRMQAQEGDTLFTDNDQIDRVDEESGNTYILSLKEKWDGYVTSQMYGNILKGIINTLAAKDAGISEVTEGVYYTSWMYIVDTHQTDETLGVNQIRVRLYNDTATPAKKNFAPCELMTIARWGCHLDPDEQGISAEEKQSRKRRQTLFMISSSDGRIVKLKGVNNPILDFSNYGTTLGELPQEIRGDEQIKDRLLDGYDYLFAQGVVVQDFIKIDIQGRIVTNYVDKGEWTDDDDTTYYATLEETDRVYYEGQYWECIANHVSSSDTAPEEGSAYWKLIIPKGEQGKTVQTAQVFKTSASQPSRPTGSTIPPSGWSNYPVKEYEQGAEVTLSYSYSGNWSRNGNVFTSDTISDNGITKERISFTCNEPVKIKVSIEASSENGYDFVLVGYPDMSNVTRAGNYKARVSGTTSSDVELDFDTAGEHFFEVAYAKDGSQSSNNDNGTFVILGSWGVKAVPIWASIGRFVDGVLQNQWSDPVQWNGEQGASGADGDTTSQIYSYSSFIQESERYSNLPTDWFYEPLTLSQQHRNVYISVRHRTNGVWDRWSDPVLFSHLAEDGTSISIKGAALTHFDTWSDFTAATKVIGATYLVDERYDEEPRPWVVVWQTGATGYMADEGDAYMVQEDGHLYLATDNISGWTDIGQVKGDKGDDAFVVDLDTYADTIAVYEGDTLYDYSKVIRVRAYYGSTDVTSSCSVSASASDVDISVYVRSDKSISIGVVSDTSLANNTITITVTHATHGTRQVVFNLNAIEKGERGERGKMGRNLYYAGSLSKVGGSTFQATDNKAPYVDVETSTSTPNCYMYVGANGDNITYPSNASDYARSSDWELMVSDFKYLITQALFSAFAKLGSWIFNGDYMFTERNASGSSTGYQNYQGMSSDEKLTSGFIPTVAFDALNGRTSLSGDKVRFNPNGSGWVANKNIEWDANGNATFKGGVSSPFEELYLDDSFEWKNYSDNYGCARPQSSYPLAKALPTGMEYSGRRITIVNGYWNGGKATGTLALQTSGNDKFYYDNNGTAEERTSIYVFAGEYIELLGYGDTSTFYGWIVLGKHKVFPTQ